MSEIGQWRRRGRRQLIVLLTVGYFTMVAVLLSLYSLRTEISQVIAVPEGVENIGGPITTVEITGAALFLGLGFYIIYRSVVNSHIEDVSEQESHSGEQYEVVIRPDPPYDDDWATTLANILTNDKDFPEETVYIRQVSTGEDNHE